MGRGFRARPTLACGFRQHFSQTTIAFHAKSVPFEDSRIFRMYRNMDFEMAQFVNCVLKVVILIFHLRRNGNQFGNDCFAYLVMNVIVILFMTSLKL